MPPKRKITAKEAQNKNIDQKSSEDEFENVFHTRVTVGSPQTLGENVFLNFSSNTVQILTWEARLTQIILPKSYSAPNFVALCSQNYNS